MMQICEDVATKRACPHFTRFKKLLIGSLKPWYIEWKRPLVMAASARFAI